MNTFGIHSVSINTLNNDPFSEISIQKEDRDLLVTTLRTHNFILNILGYIPGVSVVSGCLRILLGLTLLVGNNAIGDPRKNGKFYYETERTSAAQVVRGALEAFIPYGHIANAALDWLCTPINIADEYTDYSYEGDTRCPEPKYPFFAKVLLLA